MKAILQDIHFDGDNQLVSQIRIEFAVPEEPISYHKKSVELVLCVAADEIATNLGVKSSMRIPIYWEEKDPG